ncbi:MAG TPA: RNA methyltransferase [Acidobacteriaceae bacterium]|nr:RNA methyltransferase [Acidobacteriaceae bacterium]
MRHPPPITSRSNLRVKALRAAAAGRASAPGELTALEGEHLLAEAAAAGVELDAVFLREGDEDRWEGPALRGLCAREHFVLSRDVFDSAVGTATPQGIAGLLAIPVVKPASPEAPGPVLVLQDVQDPGNVGTLIRSAAAFGAAQVCLVGDCANPWSPKVLRSSAGAVFRVPVSRVSLQDALSSKGSRRVFASVVSGSRAVLSTAADLTSPMLLVGSEGRGLSPEALAAADEHVTVPCRIESLNAAVAGSLLLYESFRQGEGRA